MLSRRGCSAIPRADPAHGAEEVSRAGTAEPKRARAHARAATERVSRPDQASAGLRGSSSAFREGGGRAATRVCLPTWPRCIWRRSLPAPSGEPCSEQPAVPARPGRSRDTEEAPQEAPLAPTTQVPPCHSRREKPSELDRDEHRAVVPK